MRATSEAQSNSPTAPKATRARLPAETPTTIAAQLDRSVQTALTEETVAAWLRRGWGECIVFVLGA